MADALWHIAVGIGLALGTRGLVQAEWRGWFVIERKDPQF